MGKESLLVGISSQRVERVVQFRVKEGSDLLRAIGEAVKKERIHTGVIVSGLGALKKAIFRNLRWFPESYPVKPKDRLYLQIERPMELVSLAGWIAPGEEGVAEIHPHFAASMVEGEAVITMGGHLIEGTVAGIKVVVAILALEPGSAYSGLDETTKTPDIMFGIEQSVQARNRMAG